MSRTQTVESFETAVLDRIARHRAENSDRVAVSAGTLLVFAALTLGVVTGFDRAGRDADNLRGSESVVLADAARLAPSGLLAGSQ